MPTIKNGAIVLFPSCPIKGIRHIDYDYKEEAIYAKKHFNIANIDIDSIKTTTAPGIATFNIPILEELTTAIYRGWMLSQEHYSILFDYLRVKYNVALINTPKEYSALHYFPNVYDSIKQYTPETIFGPIGDLDRLLTFSKQRFEKQPVFVKDYVKSESAYPDASFISDGGNKNAMKKAISKLRELRGSEFNFGIVIKERIDIAKNKNNENIEFRAFIINGNLIDIFKRFDKTREDQVAYLNLLTNFIFEVKDKVSKFSNFFTIDIVLKTNNTFSVIEVGDGQVSGIPEHKGYFDLFYNKLYNVYNI